MGDEKQELILSPLGPVVDPVTGIALSLNDRIDRLYLKLIKEPQAGIEPKHLITPGLYTREATAPAGTMLISKTHLHEHQFIMSRGVCYSIREDGEAVKMDARNGPIRGVTKPGTRRVCFIEEETTWTSIHPTTKTDLREIEAELYGEDQLLISNHPDHVDFFKMTQELGVTPEQIAAESRNPLDQVSLPDEFHGLVVTGPSAIAGVGLYANFDFHLGETIIPAVIGDRRTAPFRRVKHSARPNAILRAENSGASIVAVGTIEAGDEITLDYRQSRKIAWAVGLLKDTHN